MNKLLISISIVSLLTLSATNSLAGNKYKRHHNHEDMARVTHVEPIYKTVRVSTPQHDCYQQPHDRSQHSNQHSYTSTIAGGLIGGVIGNQFGGGSGKTVMTVAGTLLGGSVGRDLEHRDSHQSPPHKERCRVSNRYHEEQRIDGYYVSYKYQGRHYTTEMDHRPGKRIPVEVSVHPIRNHY